MRIFAIFLLAISLAFILYDMLETEKRTYQIKNIPYDSSKAPEEFISIIVQDDDLAERIRTGKATISSTHTKGKTNIVIQLLAEDV